MQLFCAYHKIAPRFDLLDRLELSGKKDTQYQQLSAGQQRRLALALAVAHNPQVLFLDEPTAGLDVASRLALHNLMRELKAAGTTIILATHDMAEADEMTDRIAILLGGRIAATGTPLEITASGAGLSKITARTNNGSLLAPKIVFKDVTQRVIKEEYAIFYTTNVSNSVFAVLSHVEKKGDQLIDLRIERPSLEDRFLEITKKGNVK
jgi:ABC-2 type transport system ATP-binding protein